MRILIVIFFLCAYNLVNAQYNGKLIPFRIANKWGYADTNAKIVIKPQYDSVSFFGTNEMAIVKKGNVLININTKGQEFPKPLKEAQPFGSNPNYYNTGYYEGFDPENFIVIDVTSKIKSSMLSLAIYNKYTDDQIKTIECADLKSFENGDYLSYSIKSKEYFRENDFIIEDVEQILSVYSKYDFSLRFTLKGKTIIPAENYFTVQTEKGWGVVDSLGKTIVPTVYTKVILNRYGFLVVDKNSTFKLFDFQGHLLRDISHNSSILDTTNTIYIVGEDIGGVQSVYCINKFGDTLSYSGAIVDTGTRCVTIGQINPRLFFLNRTEFNFDDSTSHYLVYHLERKVLYFSSGDSLQVLKEVMDLRPKFSSIYLRSSLERYSLAFGLWYPNLNGALVMGSNIYDEYGHFLFKSKNAFNCVFQLTDNCFYLINYATFERGFPILESWLLNAKGEEIIFNKNLVNEELISKTGVTKFIPQIEVGNNIDSTVYKYAFYDFEGKELLAPIYDRIYSDFRHNNFLLVSKNGKWGVLDCTDFSLKEVIPIRFSLLNFNQQSNLFIAEDEMGNHIFSITGKEILVINDEIRSLDYDEYSLYIQDGIAFKVYDKKNSFLGYIDVKGNKYYEN